MYQGELPDRPVRVTIMRPGKGELRSFSPPGTHWLTRTLGMGSLPPPGPRCQTPGNQQLQAGRGVAAAPASSGP